MNLRTYGYSSRSLGAITPKGTLAAAAAFATIFAAGASRAQLPIPASTGFDHVGHLQAATLDPTCTASPHCGGTITVNGLTIIVPKEMVVIFPANQLTWQEVFSQAPTPYGLAAPGGPSTGLAQSDLPAPMTDYEVEVIGNRVRGGPAGADVEIAALINISQVGLNSGSGFVNFINYATGDFFVGGPIGVAAGTRIQLNDPLGRYGRPMASPDIRFSVDPDNSTVTAGTGFPMCIPRQAPPAAAVPAPAPAGVDDNLCPLSQRPLAVAPAAGFAATVFMAAPVAPPATLASLDPAVQAPIEVGDWVTFAGTVVNSGPQPTVGPFPAAGAAGTYISAHTVTTNIAIFTSPGTNPAWVRIDVSLIGTGGLLVTGAAEAAVRTRFEGFTTDTGRTIHLYGLDVNPLTGAVTDRDLGRVGVTQQPPVGATPGRWRFRPPCVATGTKSGGNKGGAGQAVAPADGICSGTTAQPTGFFLPPPREVRAVLEVENPATGIAGAPAWVPGMVATVANGLIPGQYHAPVQLYIFPEQVAGNPVVNNNFNTIPFLAQGGYTSTLGTLVSQLNPWPDSTTPAAACTVPTANAGGPYTVANGGTVPLSGSATGTAPLTFSWTVTSGSLTAATTLTPTFNAAGAASPTTASLTVTNACGTSTNSSTIQVNAAGAPTVNPIPAQIVTANTNNAFGVSATDPNGQAVTFTVTQAGAPALLNLNVVNNPANSATISFTTANFPVTQVTPAVITLQVTATNAGGVQSDPGQVTVTINPSVDTITIIAPTEYRTSLQRLIVNATITPDPTSASAEVLTLNPYITTTGTVFNPAALGASFTYTPGAGGAYVLTLVGAPQPGAGVAITASDTKGAVSAGFVPTVRQ
jgi:hypothetical protein